MNLAILLPGLLLACSSLHAQDPEFPRKEFIMHVKLQGGMATNFKGHSPDVFVGGVQVVPQYTLVAGHLRGGLIGEIFFTNKKWQAAIGPTVSWKLATINLKQFGSGGNIHLSFDHLWGTGGQRLLGGGVNIDLLNFIVMGISVHRDYALNSWWIRPGFGIRLSKVKQPPHP